MTTSPDIKPRSRDVTDGLERAAARGMLRAVGMTDDDFGKPQIGIASSWNEITPCNLSLDRLAAASKEGVHHGGGFSPGGGAGGGMYPANTRACAAEGMGMSLPGSASPPSADRRRDGFARA